MEHFVTLFDSKYLPQGVELHESMERHVPDFVLWIICMDDKAFEVLSELSLPRTKLIQLATVETPELLSVKAERSNGEYCWTVTPFAPRFVFEADNAVQRVTYVDADLWFLRNPFPIFQEFENSGKSVLITDHSYAPEYDKSETSGQFCVQFMTFERGQSEVVRKWWEERCLEWCFARFEDGKFGDQKYLDDWPTRFSDLVHVMQDKELLLAPWNVTRFPMGRAVAFHFHGVRVGRKRVFLDVDYQIPHALDELLFQPYFFGLQAAVAKVGEVGSPHIAQGKPRSRLLKLLFRIRALKRALWPRGVSSRRL